MVETVKAINIKSLVEYIIWSVGGNGINIDEFAMQLNIHPQDVNYYINGIATKYFNDWCCPWRIETIGDRFRVGVKEEIALYLSQSYGYYE